jgi:hypothetical protein
MNVGKTTIRNNEIRNNAPVPIGGEVREGEVAERVREGNGGRRGGDERRRGEDRGEEGGGGEGEGKRRRGMEQYLKIPNYFLFCYSWKSPAQLTKHNVYLLFPLLVFLLFVWQGAAALPLLRREEFLGKHKTVVFFVYPVP